MAAAAASIPASAAAAAAAAMLGLPPSPPFRPSVPAPPLRPRRGLEAFGASERIFTVQQVQLPVQKANAAELTISVAVTPSTTRDFVSLIETTRPWSLTLFNNPYARPMQHQYVIHPRYLTENRGWMHSVKLLHIKNHILDTTWADLVIAMLIPPPRGSDIGLEGLLLHNVSAVDERTLQLLAQLINEASHRTLKFLRIGSSTDTTVTRWITKLLSYLRGSALDSLEIHTHGDVLTNDEWASIARIASLKSLGWVHKGQAVEPILPALRQMLSSALPQLQLVALSIKTRDAERDKQVRESLRAVVQLVRQRNPHLSQPVYDSGKHTLSQRWIYEKRMSEITPDEELTFQLASTITKVPGGFEPPLRGFPSKRAVKTFAEVKDDEERVKALRLWRFTWTGTATWDDIRHCFYFHRIPNRAFQPPMRDLPPENEVSDGQSRRSFALLRGVQPSAAMGESGRSTVFDITDLLRKIYADRMQQPGDLPATMRTMGEGIQGTAVMVTFRGSPIVIKVQHVATPAHLVVTPTIRPFVSQWPAAQLEVSALRRLKANPHAPRLSEAETFYSPVGYSMVAMEPILDIQAISLEDAWKSPLTSHTARVVAASLVLALKRINRGPTRVFHNDAHYENIRFVHSRSPFKAEARAVFLDFGMASTPELDARAFTQQLIDSDDPFVYSITNGNVTDLVRVANNASKATNERAYNANLSDHYALFVEAATTHLDSKTDTKVARMFEAFNKAYPNPVALDQLLHRFTIARIRCLGLRVELEQFTESQPPVPLAPALSSRAWNDNGLLTARTLQEVKTLSPDHVYETFDRRRPHRVSIQGLTPRGQLYRVDHAAMDQKLTEPRKVNRCVNDLLMVWKDQKDAPHEEVLGRMRAAGEVKVSDAAVRVKDTRYYIFNGTHRTTPLSPQEQYTIRMINMLGDHYVMTGYPKGEVYTPYGRFAASLRALYALHGEHGFENLTAEPAATKTSGRLQTAVNIQNPVTLTDRVEYMRTERLQYTPSAERLLGENLAARLHVMHAVGILHMNLRAKDAIYVNSELDVALSAFDYSTTVYQAMLHAREMQGSNELDVALIQVDHIHLADALRKLGLFAAASCVLRHMPATFTPEQWGERGRARRNEQPYSAHLNAQHAVFFDTLPLTEDPPRSWFDTEFPDILQNAVFSCMKYYQEKASYEYVLAAKWKGWHDMISTRSKALSEGTVDVDVPVAKSMLHGVLFENAREEEEPQRVDDDVDTLPPDDVDADGDAKVVPAAAAAAEYRRPAAAAAAAAAAPVGMLPTALTPPALGTSVMQEVDADGDG